MLRGQLALLAPVNVANAVPPGTPVTSSVATKEVRRWDGDSATPIVQEPLEGSVLPLHVSVPGTISKSVASRPVSDAAMTPVAAHASEVTVSVTGELVDPSDTPPKGTRSGEISMSFGEHPASPKAASGSPESTAEAPPSPFGPGAQTHDAPSAAVARSRRFLGFVTSSRRVEAAAQETHVGAKWPLPAQDRVFVNLESMLVLVVVNRQSGVRVRHRSRHR